MPITIPNFKIKKGAKNCFAPQILLFYHQHKLTSHSINPVPFIVTGEEFKNAKLLKDGKLSDIAPTLLYMMHMNKPEEMTGHSLISE